MLIISAYNIIYLILLSLFVPLIESAPDPLDELTINVNVGGEDPDTTVKCGVKKKGTQFQRIAGGNETEINEYPWMVSVETKHHGHECGGSVIADKWILTAAHCLYYYPLPEIYIVLGEHDLNQTTESPIAKRVKPNWMLIHPKYEYIVPPSYDIALLRIPPIDLKIYTPICLPTQGAHYDGKNAWIYGWGYTGSVYSDVLMEVKVPVISDAEAYAQIAAGDDHHDPYNLTDTELDVMIFAGEPGKGTCKLDSGGPMSYANPNNNGRHEQIGITSWSWQCGDNWPKAYVEVSALRSWIDDTISNNDGPV